MFSFELGQNISGSKYFNSNRVLDVLLKIGLETSLSKMNLHTNLFKDFYPDGVEISGGEAQKIAIARALYRDAPILALDEPTAALDPLSEYEIYKKLNNISENKTAIFISHRMSSCKFCDRISVFDQGRLVQVGTHDELLFD